MILRGYHTCAPMSTCFIISANTLSSVTDRLAQHTPTKKETVVNKISQSGGGVPPHVVQTAHAGGGGQYICTYIHI